MYNWCFVYIQKQEQETRLYALILSFFKSLLSLFYIPSQDIKHSMNHFFFGWRCQIRTKSIERDWWGTPCPVTWHLFGNADSSHTSLMPLFLKRKHEIIVPNCNRFLSLLIKSSEDSNFRLGTFNDIKWSSLTRWL